MKVGDIANADAAGNGKPLDGIRVLALEQMQALPYATQLLARLGAEVIKIEPPTGESGRGSLPGMRDPYDRLVGATFLRNNLNKRSVAIDLKNPAGRDLVLRMAPALRRGRRELQARHRATVGARLRRHRRRPPQGRLRLGVWRRKPRRVALRRMARVRIDGRSGVGHLRVHPPAGAASAAPTRSARSATSARRCSR